MKLFQQMLVAGASVSLLVPIAVHASDVVNLEEMNSYSRSNTKKSSRLDSKTFINEVSEDIANLKGRIDGLEARQNVFEAGGFSDTTTMDGKVIFDIGAIDYSLDSETKTESTLFGYSYTANLNSSFTGDDNLYIRIKTGNHAEWMKDKTYGGYLGSVGKNSGALTVDKIWYEFPVGENNTVWVGPKIENYYMHGTAPSIYKPITKQFSLGGNGEAYGASTDTGAGWAYKADNGFAISSNVGTKSKTTTSGTDTGLLSNESKTSWATQVGLTKPQWSASVLVNQKYNGWSDTYYHSLQHGPSSSTGNFTSVGLRGWWRPLETGSATPSVSLGYDSTTYDGAPAASDSSDAWFAGLMWQDTFQADDKIGVAFGQPTTNEDETTDPFAYELYYSYMLNDSVSVTPTVFGGTDRNGTSGGDVFGALVQTTFKF